jgi:hypothetical protein
VDGDTPRLAISISSAQQNRITIGDVDLIANLVLFLAAADVQHIRYTRPDGLTVPCVVSVSGEGGLADQVADLVSEAIRNREDWHGLSDSAPTALDSDAIYSPQIA